MNRRHFVKLAVAIPKTCQQIVQKYNLDITQLDPTARYMVIVSPDNDYQAEDWRWRREITDEIKDCFQSAGIARGDVGVLVLRGYGIEIVKVKDE